MDNRTRNACLDDFRNVGNGASAMKLQTRYNILRAVAYGLVGAAFGVAVIALALTIAIYWGAL